MSKDYKDNLPISANGFMDEFMRLKRGSVSRRHFLGITGLGLATAVMSRFPGALSTPAYAGEDLGTQMSIATWPNYHDPTTFENFKAATGVAVEVNVTYALPKNWGTTGFSVNTSKIKAKPTSWKDFFELAQTEADGRAMVHDYQLTTIGSALVSLGYGFNSIKPEELAKAEELLIKVKPHLFAINSDYQPAMRATDAWMTMCWTNDGAQLNRDMPELAYILGTDGGEIWTDYYAIPKDAPNKAAGYALLNYLMDPANAVKEHIANGAPTTDSRVISLLPKEITSNKIVYPDEASLTPLEFGAAITLTDPGRAELMARFKSA